VWRARCLSNGGEVTMKPPPTASTAVAGSDETTGRRLSSRQPTRSNEETFLTPTTLFSDCPITPSEEYRKIVDPERRKILVILVLAVLLFPLMFRYACGSSGDPDVSDTTIAWGGGTEVWEWCVLAVIWFGALGNIFRLLPLVAGRPSAIESSQKCTLDGVAALGVCSPFSSEDDAILLRSLLGRACTMFHTVGSRHSIQGFYMDAILNERRIKGEVSRRNCWIAWMKFLHALVDVSLLMKEEATEDATPATLHSTDSERFKSPATPQGRAPPAPPKAPPSSPLTSGRALYVEGAIDPRGCSVSVRRSQAVSCRSGDNLSSRGDSARVSFKDIGYSLGSAAGVTEQQRSHLTTWSRDQLHGQPLSYGMMMAGTPAARSVAGLMAGPGAFVGRVLSKISEASTPTADNAGRSTAMSWTSYTSDAPETSSSGDLSQLPGAEPPSTNGTSEITPASGGYVSHSSRLTPEEADLAGDDSERIGFSAPGTSVNRATFSTRSNGAAQALYNVFATPTEPRSPRSEVHVVTPSENMIHHPPAIATFPVTPSQRPRAMTDRQNQIAAAYLRPHGIPNLELNMADIVPMIDFLDAWLEEMKENEWTYDYHKPK
jgi:nitrate reductase NapE component